MSSRVVAAIMTSVAFQIATAAPFTINRQTHNYDNKNSEHGNGGTVSNIGDSHDNHHCVGNSNNDKGIVCYINTDLFC